MCDTLIRLGALCPTEYGNAIATINPEIDASINLLFPVATNIETLKEIIQKNKMWSDLLTTTMNIERTIKARIQNENLLPNFQTLQSRNNPILPNLNCEMLFASTQTPNGQISDNSDSAQVSAMPLILTHPPRRTTPEYLLLAQGDLPHLRCTGQLSEFMLSSSQTICFSTITDKLGYQRQTFWALGCATFIEPNNSATGPVIRYRSAEISFYKGLGGQPP